MDSQKSFLVTARKFRPLLFKDVIGQSHITKTLMNSIIQNRIHHAYLFNGPRGVGKTTTARIFARAVNCKNLQNGEPCNQCEPCLNALEGRSLDIIEIDGASNNSVDDIRKLRENVKFPPVHGKYKMYIIDEVHMLSTSAFNALLKTLEEPPEHLLFVFATTEPHKVLPTIMSRCQRFDFRRMELEDITFQLNYIAKQESIEIDDQSLYSIAKKADGSMRDAESIFDQVVAFTGNKITYQLLSDALHLIDEDFFFEISNAILNNDLHKMFEIASIVSSRGYDYIETMQGLLEHFRNILAVKIANDNRFLITSKFLQDKYLEHSKEFETNDVLRIIQIISNSEQQLKYSPQQKIRFELVLSQLASLPKSLDIKSIIDLIQNQPMINLSQPSSISIDKKETSKLPSKETLIVEEKSPQAYDAKINTEKKNEINNEKKFILKNEIESKWNDFIIYASQNTILFESLKKDIIAEFGDNQVKLLFKSQIIYKNFISEVNKQKFAELLNNFYNSELTITYNYEPEKNELQVGKSKKFQNELTTESEHQTEEKVKIKTNENINTTKTTQTSSNEKNNKLSEIEDSLIRIFNATLLK